MPIIAATIFGHFALFGHGNKRGNKKKVRSLSVLFFGQAKEQI